MMMFLAWALIETSLLRNCSIAPCAFSKSSMVKPGGQEYLYIVLSSVWRVSFSSGTISFISMWNFLNTADNRECWIRYLYPHKVHPPKIASPKNGCTGTRNKPSIAALTIDAKPLSFSAKVYTPLNVGSVGFFCSGSFLKCSFNKSFVYALGLLFSEINFQSHSSLFLNRTSYRILFTSITNHPTP